MYKKKVKANATPGAVHDYGQEFRNEFKNLSKGSYAIAIVVLLFGIWDTVQATQELSEPTPHRAIGNGNPAAAEHDMRFGERLSEDHLVIVNSEQKKHAFKIELALTFEQQQKGLMHRESIDDDYGMLFVYSKFQDVMMWMKNTIIPLDMVFIDNDGKILHIAENAKPYDERVISSRFPVRATLEIKGGQAAARGIKVGDTVYNSYFGNSSP
jgi:uncharacterized protein